MKSERNVKRGRGSGGTDLGSPFQTKIFYMDITPVIDMRIKIRRNCSDFSDEGQLVRREKLPVDNDGPPGRDVYKRQILR